MTWLFRLLPALSGAGRRTRAVGCLAFCAMIAGLGLHIGSIVAGVAGSPVAFAAPALCYLGVIVLLGLRAATATDARRGWQALAAAVGLWLAGTATATFVG